MKIEINFIKILGIMLIIVTTLDLVLFVANKISGSLFWSVIVFAAIMAYIGLPYLRKKHSKK